MKDSDPGFGSDSKSSTKGLDVLIGNLLPAAKSTTVALMPKSVFRARAPPQMPSILQLYERSLPVGLCSFGGPMNVNS